MMGYNDLSTHQMMLEDKIRTESYRTAIARVVKSGDRVIDFGCGTGILSFFSSKSGANQVYAVDEAGIIRVAKLLAEKNGFKNIEFYHDDGSSFEISEPVDVIVSEWMGCFLFHEWMHVPLLHLRNRFLKVGGTMIPRAVKLKMGLIVDEKSIGNMSFLASMPYGIDFSMVKEWPFLNVFLKNIDRSMLLPNVLDLGTIEMGSCIEMPEGFSGSIHVEASADIFGLCGWFEADLCEGVGFGTGPFDPPTHWQQLVFPFSTPVRVKAGDTVEVGVSPFRREKDKTTLWSWYLSGANQRVEMDDFVHRAWLSRELPQGKLI